MKQQDYEVSYHSDVFIKYCMTREDEDSAYIRNSIIRYVTGITPKESVVLNPELDASILHQKSIILDVHVKDEEGREYDIEMQVSGVKQSLQMRFEYYGGKMLAEQLSIGEIYDELKPIHQIIIIKAFSSANHKLIDHYQMRNEEGDMEYTNALQHRSYVYVSQINKIVEEKGIEGLNEFEQVCYLLENDANHAILKTKEGLVKKLMEKHKQMRDDRSIWSIARSQEIKEQQDKLLLRDYYNDGKAEGILEGKVEGKIEGKIEGEVEGYRMILCKQIKNKYQIDALEWLSMLSQEQLIVVSDAILEAATYEDLQHTIDKTHTL